MFAHPADLFRGYTDHQGIGFDVFTNNGARTDKGVFAEGNATDDSAVGAEGAAAFYQGVAVFLFAFDLRTRVVDIGKYHARAAEDAVFQSDLVVYGNVVLDFAVVTDTHLVADKDILTQRAMLADAGLATDVYPVPDAAAGADLGACVDDGGGVNGSVGHQCIVCVTFRARARAVVHLPPSTLISWPSRWMAYSRVALFGSLALYSRGRRPEKVSIMSAGMPGK